MALKYIPYGYGDCRLKLWNGSGWVSYIFGVMNKFKYDLIEVTDRFMNNKGNYKDKVIGYGYKFKLELVSKDNSKLGNQLNIIDFMNAYFRYSSDRKFHIFPQYGGVGQECLVNVSYFMVLCEKPPQIESFKINRKLGQKLVLSLITRDLIPFGVGGIWVPYKDTDGNWDGYEVGAKGIMDETFDNV